MRIGMVCPYSFDVPGGVQSHVLQLAEVMRAGGHYVSVLAPSSPHVKLPDYVVSGGKAVPIPYNGSVARLRFGPATHRKVKKWIAEGEFDVLHLHEPNAPSLSMLALQAAEGPIVATFHTSTTKSLTLSVFQEFCARITRRSSAASRCRTWPGAGRWKRSARMRSRYPTVWTCRRSRMRLGWKGIRGPAAACCSSAGSTNPVRACAVLLRALPKLVRRFADIEILIVGRGDEDALREEAGELAGHLRFLGQVDDDAKAAGHAQRRRVLRTQPRRRELRHRAGRGDGGGHAGGGQ